jgi:dolichol-phosphate mannosyltransferase
MTQAYSPSKSEAENGTLSRRSRSESAIGVSVIIPTYNERENIGAIIPACLNALPSPTFDTEVVVVDDDSEDYTWQYPRRLFGSDPRVRVIRRQTDDPGLAQSVTDGFAAATHEFCAVMDADFQHPPNKLPELITSLDGSTDIAIGSRHVDGGGIENWSTWRKAVSKGGTGCAKAALPGARGVSDPMSGFFAVRRSAVEDVDLDPQGYKILLEILEKGEYESITEVPYVFQQRERGESNLSAEEIRQFLEHVGQLTVVSHGLDGVIGPWRAVRASEFALVGAIGAVVNMVVFALLTLVEDAFFMFAGGVAFLAAVNWNFVGNWFLTYDRPGGNLLRQYVRFHVVSITGFVVYNVALVASAGAGVSLLPANAIAILTGAGFNFIGSDTAVFPTDGREDVSTAESTQQSDAAHSNAD